MLRPEHPVFSSTKSTRVQCSPPSVVRKTPVLPADPWRGQGASEDNVGIGRVNDDPADASRLGQPHVTPGDARIDGFVDAVALDIALSRMAQASPVPAQTIRGFDGATASEPIAWTGCPSKIGVKVRAASVVFQIPPDAAPM
jgi:hypothetical protein